MRTSPEISNAEFLRKQLIVVAACVPVLFTLFYLPFAVLAVVSLLFQPLYAVGLVVAAVAYIALGIRAWRRHHLVWTLLFVLASSAPLVDQFVVLPEMQKRRFRNSRRISASAKIVYYREAGFNDVTRFCIIQHPQTGLPRSNVTEYRPFPQGALATMRTVQSTLGIPDSKMPDPNKQTVSYSGRRNGTESLPWMYLRIYDSESAREWLFENTY